MSDNHSKNGKKRRSDAEITQKIRTSLLMVETEQRNYQAQAAHAARAICDSLEKLNSSFPPPPPPCEHCDGEGCSECAHD